MEYDRLKRAIVGQNEKKRQIQTVKIKLLFFIKKITIGYTAK